MKNLLVEEFLRKLDLSYKYSTECERDLIEADLEIIYNQGRISGIKFAQRWIPVEEELPEHSMPTIVDGMYQETGHVIYKTSNGKCGTTSRVQFMDHGFYWKGSGTLRKSIVSWRLIELK